MDIKKQISIAGEGARLVAKQAEKFKLLNISLPAAYRKLGEEIYKSGILKDSFAELFSGIDFSIKAQEDLVKTDPIPSNFTYKMKSAVKSAKNMAVSKKMEYDRSALFSQLGCQAYEYHREKLTECFSTESVAENLKNIAALEQSIAVMDSTGRGSFFNPKTAAVGMIGVVVLGIALLGYKGFFGVRQKENNDSYFAGKNSNDSKDLSTNLTSETQITPNSAIPSSETVDSIGTNKKTINNKKEITKGISNNKENNGNLVISDDTRNVITKLKKLNITHLYQNQSGNYSIVELYFPDDFRGSDLDVINDIPTLKGVSLPRGIETYELVKTHDNVEIIELRGVSNCKDIPRVFPKIKHLEIYGFNINNLRSPKNKKLHETESDPLPSLFKNLLELESLVVGGCDLRMFENVTSPKNLKYVHIGNMGRSYSESSEKTLGRLLLDPISFKFTCFGSNPFDYKTLKTDVLVIEKITDKNLNEIIDNKEIKKIFIDSDILKTSTKSTGTNRLADKTLIKLKNEKERFIESKFGKKSDHDKGMYGFQDDFVLSLYKGPLFAEQTNSNRSQEGENFNFNEGFNLGSKPNYDSPFKPLGPSREPGLGGFVMNDKYKTLVNRIRPGMSREQVEGILGTADEETVNDLGKFNPQKAGQILKILTWNGDGADDPVIILGFINNRLTQGGTPGYDIIKGFHGKLPSKMSDSEKSQSKKALNKLGFTVDD